MSTTTIRLLASPSLSWRLAAPMIDHAISRCLRAGVEPSLFCRALLAIHAARPGAELWELLREAYRWCGVAFRSTIQSR